MILPAAMLMSRTFVRSSRRIPGVLVVATVAACRPEAPASPGVHGPLETALATSNVADYSRMSADVVVETQVVNGSAGGVIAAPGTRRFRVDATRKADRSWQTVLTLPPRERPFPAGREVAPELDLARIELDGDAPPRFHSRAGTLMVFPEPSRRDGARAGVEQQLSPAIRDNPAQAFAGRRPPSDAWLRGFVARGDGGFAARQALEQQFGAPIRSMGTTDVYKKSARDTTVEVSLNGDVGEISQVAFVVNDERVVQIAYAFTEVAPGTFARTTTETVRVQRDGSRITTRVHYTNTVLSR